MVTDNSKNLSGGSQFRILDDMSAHIMIGNKMSDHRLLFVDLHLVHVWVDQWWEAFLLVQSLSYVMQQTMHLKLEVWIEETTGRCTWRLDYQLLFRKMCLCSSPWTPSGTRLERTAEIEPNVYGDVHKTMTSLKSYTLYFKRSSNFYHSV